MSWTSFIPIVVFVLSTIGGMATLVSRLSALLTRLELSVEKLSERSTHHDAQDSALKQDVDILRSGLHSLGERVLKLEVRAKFTRLSQPDIDEG